MVISGDGWESKRWDEVEVRWGVRERMYGLDGSAVAAVGYNVAGGLGMFAGTR